jgi:hypothetical protein
LRQGEMTILDHETRFHDLFMFAPYYVPIEKHMIEKLRDNL